MRTAVIALLIAGLAFRREARAQSADDLATLVVRACAKVPEASRPQPAYAKLCTNSQFARDQGKQYPSLLYKTRDPALCDELQSLRGLAPNDNDLNNGINGVCGTPSHETGANFGGVAISLVQGLGDVLLAEAKEEALDYMLSQIGKSFCNLSITVDAAAVLKIEARDWFARSCAVILPGGEVDVDGFSFGALKVAFKADLVELPKKIAVLAQGWMALHWKSGPSYLAALGVAIYVAYELVEHRRPVDILQQLGDEADTQLKGKLTCDLRTKTSITKECVLILAFELARTAATSKDPSIAAQIEQAIVKFCADYGAEGLTADGACVITSEDYAQIHADLLAVYDAIARLLKLGKTIASVASDHFAPEVSKRAAPEWAAALRQLVDALGKAAADVDRAHAVQIAGDFALLDLAFDAFDAVVGDDPGAVRKALLDLLSSPVIGTHVDATIVHAITVVVSLATAKDRAEVKGIMADITAPVGTYKMKYGTRHTIVALNGFVGFFAGGELRLHSRNPDGSHRDPVTDGAPIKLAAPVGVDVTFPVWDRFNLGATATVIDPLALVVTTSNDTVGADWKTLFEPGLYIRLGVVRSPFGVLVGGNYQWGRRSDQLCGTARCYDGAFQLGALLSIDVPLLMLP